MALEKTVTRSIGTEGVGIHSGRHVRLVLRPAPPGSGVVFVRTDLGCRVPARAENLRSHLLATTLGADGVEVGTVEHLLAALHGRGVTNVEVEIDGAEVPILDGSALPFVEMIEEAGVEEQGVTLPEIVVTSTVRVADGERWIEVHPAAALQIDYRVRFEAAAIGWQHYQAVLDPTRFADAIAPARTFGMLSEAPELRRRGLGLGASLDNCVVVDGHRVLSGPLRFQDEFVRHKVLDLIGDLALLEYPLVGRIVAHRAGHGLHLALVRELLARPESWVLAEPGRAAAFTVRPYHAELEASAG